MQKYGPSTLQADPRFHIIYASVGEMNGGSCDICICTTFGSFVFLPFALAGVFLHSRVTGTCSVCDHGLDFAS